MVRPRHGKLSCRASCWRQPARISRVTLDRGCRPDAARAGRPAGELRLPRRARAAKMAVAESVPGDGRILSASCARRRARPWRRPRARRDAGGGERDRTCTTRSVYVDARGEMPGIVSKIHLFDVAIPDGAASTASRRRSSRARPGESARRRPASSHRRRDAVRRPDHLLRPALSRALPALVARGRAHPDGAGGVHAAHQARGIENLSFVLAAAQFGRTTSASPSGTPASSRAGPRARRRCGDARASPSPSSTSTIRIGCARELPALEHRRL